MSFLKRRRTVVVSALLASSATIAAIAPLASADSDDEYVQAVMTTQQRADHIMSQNYKEFDAYAESQEAPFDWETDGCSAPTPLDWAEVFKDACEMHDFGYRNYGELGTNRLRLDPTEARREQIDNRFLEGMQRICADRPDVSNCDSTAKLIHFAVRNYGADYFFDDVAERPTLPQ